MPEQIVSEWVMTDDDCLQFCRPVPATLPDYYELVQINSFPGHVDGVPFYQVAHGHIYMGDYTEEEILNVLGNYGFSSMDDFVEQTSPDWNVVYKEDGTIDRENSPSYIIDFQLLSEMLFETEVQEYVELETGTWNEAVSRIAEITNQDLNAYKDNDLVLAFAERKGTRYASAILTQDEWRKGCPDHKQSGEQYRAVTKLYMWAPAQVASELARHLERTHPQDAPVLCSDDARVQLAELMRPILEADISHDRHRHPMEAIRWGFDHMDYVKDVDAVLSALGLLEVKRYRRSVTQGSVAVLCNGQEIVRYGDDIKLRVGELRGAAEDYLCTTGPQFGLEVSGWASVKADSEFRRAALLQYAENVVKALEHTPDLDKVVQIASGAVPSQGTMVNAPVTERKGMDEQVH